MGRLVAVTGATGFLGRYIVGALASAGWTVRILARRTPEHPQLAQVDFEVVAGDLSDRKALSALVDGAEAVIHAAALIKAPNAATFRSVNVDGTANLARALRERHGTARVLLVSSMAAREPRLSAYARTKRASEEALASLLGAGHAWLILRPCAIYGPWDRETLGLFRALARGLAPRMRPGHSRLALIHVADAARAIAALCDRGPAGTRFELTDERAEGYSWDEVIAAAERALQVKAASLPVPGLALRAVAVLNAAAARTVGRTPMLTLGKVREILHADWGSTAASQPPCELWRPVIGLPQGFEETVRWYKDQRWLRSASPTLAGRGALH